MGGEGSQTDVERDTPRPSGAREEVGGEGRRRVEESLQGTACAIQEYCYPPESVSAGTSHSAPSLGREGREGGGKIGGGGGDVTGVSQDGEDASNTGSLTAVLIYLFCLM